MVDGDDISEMERGGGLETGPACSDSGVETGVRNSEELGADDDDGEGEGAINERVE